MNRPDYQGLLQWIFLQLRDTTYRCPGSHGSATHSSDYYEGERHEEAYRKNPPPNSGTCLMCAQPIDQVDPNHWADGAVTPELPEGYREHCDQPMSIAWEYEYPEMSATPVGAWPVVDGPCVDALGLDDTTDREDTELLGRFFERTQLYHRFISEARKYRVVIHRDLLPNDSPTAEEDLHGHY